MTLDGIIFERSRTACAETASNIRSDLERAGWFFAEDKCKWDPSQTCTWLGFNIDLSSMSISVAPERLATAVHRLEVIPSHHCHHLSKPSLHERLRWAGTLSSLHTVLNIIDKRNTRAVSRVIAAAQAQDWPLSKAWPKLAKSTSSYATGQIGYDKVPNTVFHIIDVDASDHPVGAFLRDSNGTTLARTFRELPHYLLGESSTPRELFAIHFALDTYKECIDRVLINTDSQSSVTIYNKGIRWVPRSENEEADCASRQIDFDDWKIADRVFTAVTSKWGKPLIDMFANDRNTRCSIFFSRFHCPGSSGSLILNRGKVDFYGILGCPLWESQPFYPIIKNGDAQWAGFVLDSVCFPVGTKLFKNPQLPGAFGSEFSLSPFVFLFIDFTQGAYSGTLRLAIAFTVSGVLTRPPLFLPNQKFFFGARRFNEAASLRVRAEQMGMPHISEAILNAINSDRAPSTIKAYTSEVETKSGKVAHTCAAFLCLKPGTFSWRNARRKAG
ncbi:hypothetical protein COOONC_01551 [Cooperia oncophora]